MTDGYEGQLLKPGRGITAFRVRALVALLLLIGAVIATGGVIVGRSAQAAADHAAAAASSPQLLPVFAHSKTFFPEASLTPDYSGLFAGVGIAVVGMVIVLAGLMLASRNPRVR